MDGINTMLIDRLGLARGIFNGRVALITGAARGIGESTARTLSFLGAQVIIVDRLIKEGRAVAASIREAGGQAQFLRCDLAKVGDISRLISRAQALYGPIDLLINDALHVSVAPLVAYELKEWEYTFAVNVRAPFLLIKALLPGMIAKGSGTIVNVVAYEGTALASAYAATKSATRSMARSVAQEIPPGVPIHAFSFVPGIVDTPLIHKILVPQLSQVTGLPEEVLLAGLAQNPGYAGLMPRDECATALVYCIAHAEEYNAQVADPFDPLKRFGVISVPEVDAENARAIDVAGAVSQDVKNYLRGLTDLNHDLEQRIDVRTHELEVARARSESLLLNILPSPIAERLKQGEAMIADHFDQATVLFADIANFTPLSARLSPQRVVQLLDQIFSAFDEIVGRYELEKIKTIGDCYMVVGGLPKTVTDHSERVARAALEMLPALQGISRDLDLPLDVRVGIHRGPVVAGIIGRQKFIYDLWGDTVNTASRMESQGLANHIHTTDAVQTALQSSFIFESRGSMDIKGKGPMPTWFLMGVR